MVRLFTALALAVAVTLPATGADTPVPLTVVSFSAPDSAHGRRWVRFEDRLRDQLGERVALTMLTGGQVGNEENMLSSLRRGRAQMGIISVGALSALVPELSVLAAPFLFESDAEADFIMDEVLFEPYASLLAERGLTLVKWEDGGWHNIYARRPLTRPEDLRNYRLRSSATDATRLFLGAFGADVIVLDFGDMVSAQETGLVDGGVTTSVMYRVTGLYEDAPHFILTRHGFAPGILLANQAWRKSIPEAVYQTIVAAHGTAVEGRRAVRAELADSLAAVDQAGAVLHALTPAQRRAWAEAARPVTEALVDSIGGEAERLYQLVLDAKDRFAVR